MAKTDAGDLRRKLLEAHDRGEGIWQELARRFGVSGPLGCGGEDILAAARSGWRLANVHGNTDTVFDAVFGMVEQLLKEGSATLEEIREPGWNFDHLTFVNPKQAELAAKYGIWADFQVRAIAGETAALQNYGPEYMPGYRRPRLGWMPAPHLS